ncbi:hypothetical protein ACLB1M_30000 [Escherichia coli]
MNCSGRGFAWLDAGTARQPPDEPSPCADSRKTPGLSKIACLEEIAWRNGWLDDEGVKRAAAFMANLAAGPYLLELLRARPRQY